MKVEAKIQGLGNVLKSVARLAASYPAAAGAALYEEGLELQARSMDLTPVDFGRLKGSAYTAPPTNGSDGPEVKVGYGVNYAVYVHERLEARHTVGQAKFLETAANERRAGYARRMAERIKGHVERGTRFAILDGDPED